MTIEELIAELKKYPPERRVIIRGYEDGYNDILSLIERKIALNSYKEDYYGAHGDAKNGSEGIPALELYGENTNAEE